MAGAAGDISLPDVSKLNDLKDDQIEALIEKLAEVQAHAPQIIAALEAQQESRSRGSKSKGSKGDNNSGRKGEQQRTQPPKQQRHQSPQPPTRRQSRNEQPAEAEEEEEEEDDEEYDDFDEDAEYPMVGDGYSDEVSVMSDMTTPTVVSSMLINEEEHYHEIGIKVNAPKKKDLLSKVAQTNARKAPVVAPKKKALASADTALKKPARAASNYASRPTDGKAIAKPDAATPTKKKKSKDGAVTTPKESSTKKTKKKTTKKKAPSPHSSGSGWDITPNGNSSSGVATASKKKQPQQKAEPVMIDDDGFLVTNQSAFESFDSANNPFASTTPSFTTDGAVDAFGDFDDDPFAAKPAPAPAKKTKAKKLQVSSTGKKKSSGSVSGTSPKQKRKGTRRASIGT
ncbi:expressed unknown protein [Seminavis robusta]|uniref:Uncharacterized protein n=1 Tax=Seminavis robusta TaxID=568900 RepID=A0A9N8EKQ6_9STRA|nr:expressed unknown protein [Seminavis robusta]|eukprot:Sro1124_g243840.1 n/a (399) ;mRNA; r:25383-26579